MFIPRLSCNIDLLMENIESIKRNVANNIATLRKSKGLTQAELAEKLNYSDKSISKWERKEGFPDIFTLKELADFFDVTVDDLYSDKPIVKKKKPSFLSKSKIIVPLLSIGLVWLVSTILFMFAVLFFYHEIPNSWLIFIYAIPISGIIGIVFSNIEHHRLYNLISESILVWGAGVSVYLTLLFTYNPIGQWLVFTVCGVLEILAILYYVLKDDKIKFKIKNHKENNDN